MGAQDLLPVLPAIVPGSCPPFVLVRRGHERRLRLIGKRALLPPLGLLTDGSSEIEPLSVNASELPAPIADETDDDGAQSVDPIRLTLRHMVREPWSRLALE